MIYYNILHWLLFQYDGEDAVSIMLPLIFEIKILDRTFYDCIQTYLLPFYTVD